MVGGLIGGAGFIANSEPNDRWRTGYYYCGWHAHILAAGVLAGVLIESGAANSIAETITNKLQGETRALLALALATMILTAVGVFRGCGGDCCFRQLALALSRRSDLSKAAILLAMSWRW